MAMDLNREFLIENVKMAQKYLKNVFIILTFSVHLTPVRKANINRTTSCPLETWEAWEGPKEDK